MKLKELIKSLEDYAPLQLQENYDNAGLVVGNREWEVKGVLCTVDVTPAVMEEAISLGSNLILSHHPVIFQGIKSITGKTENEEILIKAIKHDIAIYSAHTNLDNINTGINKAICEKLGLKDCRILQPLKAQLVKLVTFVPVDSAEIVKQAIFDAGAGKIGNYDSCSFNLNGQGTFRGNEDTNPFVGEKGKLHTENETRVETIVPKYLINRVIEAMIKVHPYEEVAYDIYPLENEFPIAGAGMIGLLEKPLKTDAFLSLLKNTFKIPVIRYSGNDNMEIHNVAVCGGSGSFLIRTAIQKDAQAFITGDIKYHQFFEAENKMLLCDIGHYESEQFAKEIFYSLLIKKISTFAVHLSKEVTNPIKYY